MSWIEDHEIERDVCGQRREPERSELREAVAQNRFRADARYIMSAAPDNPAARAALAPILRAGKASRFRVLDVACPKGHRLAMVYRTPAGFVITGRGPITEGEVSHLGGDSVPHPEYGYVDTPWAYDWHYHRRGNRQDDVCCFLTDLRIEHGDRGVKLTEIPPDIWADGAGVVFITAELQCRCRTADIDRQWFEARIAEGKRRVVYDRKTR